MSKPSLTAQLFMRVLKNAQHGTITILMPDLTKAQFGTGPQVAYIELKNWATFDDFVTKGDLGLAEAIINGDIVVDHVAALVEWACKNDQALGQAMHGTILGTLIYQIKNLLNRNSKKQAKKNIMAHYDLGNNFYKLWLDRTMTYSSGLFVDGNESLEQAQLNKYDRMIEKLNLKSSDHVLEIGCGWGGFFSRAVEKTGCKVTAVMNSPSQAQHNREMIAAKGMNSYVDLREIDYRDIEGSYDKVVSIEMIEAVGEQYWDNYFQKVAGSLKSKGSAIIQGITIREDLFYSYRKQTDFIQNYVFPGGMLLTNTTFDKQSKKNSMQLADQYEFGISYADTLKMWRENFNAVSREVTQMGFDEKFMRLWNLYLSYCEGAFRAGRINVGQYLIQTT